MPTFSSSGPNTRVSPIKRVRLLSSLLSFDTTQSFLYQLSIISKGMYLFLYFEACLSCYLRNIYRTRLTKIMAPKQLRGAVDKAWVLDWMITKGHLEISEAVINEMLPDWRKYIAHSLFAFSLTYFRPHLILVTPHTSYTYSLLRLCLLSYFVPTSLLNTPLTLN